MQLQKKSRRYLGLLSYLAGGSIRREVGPWCAFETPIWGRGSRRGQWLSAYHSNSKERCMRGLVLLIRIGLLSICDSCDVSNHSAAICHRMFRDAQINRAWIIHFQFLGQNLKRKGLSDVSRMLSRLWKRLSYGAVVLFVCKRNRVNRTLCLLPFGHNAQTWQTNSQTERPRNGNSS